jgi:hypothetical protein
MRRIEKQRLSTIAVVLVLVITTAGCTALPFVGGNSDSGPESSTTVEESTTTVPLTSKSSTVSTTSTGSGVELGENTPSEVVRTFYDAVYSGDVETANRLIHQNSSAPLYTEESLQTAQTYDHEIQNLTELNRTATTAKYRLDLKVTGENMTQTRTQTIQLRVNETFWRIWG